MQGVSGRLLGISPLWLISMEPCGNRSDVYELHQNPPSCGHIINPQISTKRMTDLQKWSWRKVGCFHKCWTGSQNLGHHLSLFKVGCHSTGNSPAVYAEQHGYNFYTRTPTNHSTSIPPCSLPKWNLPYASQILGVGSISALNTQFISILFPSSEYRWHRQVKSRTQKVNDSCSNHPSTKSVTAASAAAALELTAEVTSMQLQRKLNSFCSKLMPWKNVWKICRINEMARFIVSLLEQEMCSQNESLESSTSKLTTGNLSAPDCTSLSELPGPSSCSHFADNTIEHPTAINKALSRILINC